MRGFAEMVDICTKRSGETKSPIYKERVRQDYAVRLQRQAQAEREGQMAGLQRQQGR